MVAIIKSERHVFLVFLLVTLLKEKQNSANIIVQNRITGQLEEDKMQRYVRLGIRLLYKGATSRMDGGRDLFFALVFYIYF